MYKPKKVTLVFVCILFVLLIWPILTAFNTIEPRVLGLPFSVFWELLIFAVLTIGMIVLTYTAEKEE
jgi:hypothetical protein